MVDIQGHDLQRHEVLRAKLMGGFMDKRPEPPGKWPYGGPKQTGTGTSKEGRQPVGARNDATGRTVSASNSATDSMPEPRTKSKRRLPNPPPPDRGYMADTRTPKGGPKKPYEIKHSAPNPKVPTAAVGGPALASLIVWIAGLFHLLIPTDVALTIAALLVLAVGYVVPGRSD